MRFRQVLLVTVFCLFLCGPALLFGATKAGIALPDQVTAKSAVYLSGGITDADVSSVMNLEGFMNKDFQNATETEIGNYIPAKANIMLANARLQRTLIKSSNAVFGYDCYPTFYDSDYIETADEQYVLNTSSKLESGVLERFQIFVDEINEFAAEFPDVNILICLVDDPGWSDANPSYKYVSNTPGDDFVKTNLVNQLDSRIHVISDMDYDTSSYFDRFLPTEHHWSFNGWSEAYRLMAEELLWDSLEDAPVVSYDDYWCIGAEARAGLDLDAPPFHLKDYDLQNDQLEYYIDGARIDEPGQKGALRKNSNLNEQELQYLGYWAYYGPNYPELSVANNDPSKTKKAVYITNSHGKPLISYIASNYQSLEKYDPFNQVADINLSEMASRGELNDLIFVFEPGALRYDTIVDSSIFD